MARTPVTPNDIAAAVASAINSTTCNGGTLRAQASGAEVKVWTHNDAPLASYNSQFSLRVS